MAGKLYQAIVRMFSKPTIVLTVIFLLLGSFLRLAALGAKSMWFDEVLSVQMSAKNIDQIWHELTKFTNSPPLYLWLLHFFLKIEVSEFWARLPSAIFGILTLPLVYHFSRELFNKRVAFFALCLFVLSPMHIYYSQEARMYSLWTFLLTLSYFFLYKLCKGNSSPFLWAGYFASTLMSLYTHYFSVFHLLAQGGIAAAYFLWSKEKKNARWWKFSITWGMILLCSIPLISLSKQGFTYGNGLPLQDWSLRIVFEEILRSWLVFITLGGGGGYYLHYNFPLAFFLFLLFYIGMVACLRRNKRPVLLLLTWIVLPLYTGIFFLVGRTAFHERFFFPVTVPYLLFAAVGIRVVSYRLARFLKGLRQRKIYPFQTVRFRVSPFFPSLILLGLFFGPILQYYQIEKQDNRGAEEYVAAHFLPGDSIVFDGFGEAALAYYFQDFSLSVARPKTVQAIDILGKSCRRVWYLYGWESSGVWDKPGLYAWSQQAGVQPHIIAGAFPIQIKLIGPDAKDVPQILDAGRARFTQAPGDVQDGLEVGNCLLTLGRWQEALSVYEEVGSVLRDQMERGSQDAQINRQLTQVLLGIGDAQARQQHWKEAALAYQEAMRADTANVTDREDILSVIQSGINRGDGNLPGEYP